MQARLRGKDEAVVICPTLRFTRATRHVGGRLYAVRIEAHAKGQGRVGAITVVAPQTPHEDLNIAYVSHVLVDEAFHRCGVGTQLYERAAKIACKDFKHPLHSDVERTGYAQAFWEKQIRKGRAVCIARAPARNPIEMHEPVVGRGGCERYKLTCPAPKSLARARRLSR